MSAASSTLERDPELIDAKGFGRNSLGAGGVNYRICRLGYFTNRRLVPDA